MKHYTLNKTTRSNLLCERLIPSEVDRSDPDQVDQLNHVERQYRFASFFVENKRVLDIGCGVGYGPMMLLKEGGASSILAVDPDEICIEIANRDYSSERIEYRCCGYEELNEPKRFDSVVCLNVIEHVKEPRSLLSRIRELVTSGGEAIVSAFTTPTTDFNPTHFNDFSSASFRRAVRKSGFRILHEFELHKHFRPETALSDMKYKKAEFETREGPKSLIRYYLAHPIKAIRRARSLLFDGLKVKNLVIHARAV